jgi:hypothetical protein
MVTSQNERTSKARVVRLGGREIITEGLHLNFWADISHPDIRFGHRYADILGTSEDGRLGIDYGRFHETLEGVIVAFVPCQQRL